MLYTRGLPAEYNAWSIAGRQGWSYDDLREYFARSETDLDQKSDNPDEYHGIQGLLLVCIQIVKILIGFLGEWKNRSHADCYWGHTK